MPRIRWAGLGIGGGGLGIVALALIARLFGINPLSTSDQPENEADRKITQEIRQAVTKDDSLSTSAQNVQIVTENGKVTLHGTVKTEGEKEKIADKAKLVSGVQNVENLITVEQ